MSCALISRTAASGCPDVDGGIFLSYMINADEITGVTFGASGEVTAIALEALATVYKYEFDDDQDSAYYNQIGEREGKKHTYAQEGFFKFAGIPDDYSEFSDGMTGCCGGLVILHFLNSGQKLVQGIEKTTDAWKKSKQKCYATLSTLSDTPDGEERVEVKLNSIAKQASKRFTMTATELDALM